MKQKNVSGLNIVIDFQSFRIFNVRLHSLRTTKLLTKILKKKGVIPFNNILYPKTVRRVCIDSEGDMTYKGRRYAEVSLEEKEDDLKCPYCNGDSLVYCRRGSNRKYEYQVKCIVCRSMTNRHSERSEAIKEWTDARTA